MKAIDFLVENKVAISRAQGRRLIQSGAIKINGLAIESDNPNEVEIDLKDEDVVTVGSVIVRR